jgi:hypothetical protein
MNWYLQKNGAVHGPYTIAQLASGAKSGKLLATDRLSGSMNGPWSYASMLPELSVYFDPVELDNQMPAYQAPAKTQPKFKTDVEKKSHSIVPLAVNLSMLLVFLISIFIIYAVIRSSNAHLAKLTEQAIESTKKAEQSLKDALEKIEGKKSDQTPVNPVVETPVPPPAKREESPIAKPIEQPAIEAKTGPYDIKGIRFGMTFDEVLAITKAQNDKKLADNWFYVLENFTIGGINGWKAMGSDKSKMFNKAGVLEVITYSGPSEKVDNALETFTKAYGQPIKFEPRKVMTKGGVELNDFIAEWHVQDAIIVMQRHTNRDDGFIVIQNKAVYDREMQKRMQQKEEATKDF